jgi:hypothetical protein
MDFKIVTKNGESVISADIKNLMVVGFSGKDVEKTMEHIHELEKEGVKCPSEVPVPYQCDPQIVTRKEIIDVIGPKTSGETEYLILCHEGKFYIGIGSDHTDREMEAVSIHKSKQVCLKPCSVEFWDYEEVKDHLPQLRLISTQVVDGKEIDYQNGVAGDLLPFDVIIEKVQKEVPLEDCLIYTGTVPLLNGFRFGEQFSARLVDDQLGRELSLTYKIHVIDEH